MPKLDDFIRAEKTEVKISEWREGRINPSSFPLSGAKRAHYRYGPAYCWRLVTFQCLGTECRVLIIINESKGIFRSIFAVSVDNDLAVLCTHEYHADHPGWHCHVERKALADVRPGIFRTGQRRWPAVRARHSQVDFGINKASAITHVAARFGFAANGELL